MTNTDRTAERIRKIGRDARAKPTLPPVELGTCYCGREFFEQRELWRHMATDCTKAKERILHDLRRSDGTRLVAVCGTTGGYQAHLDRKEPPCDDCKAAQNEQKRAAYAAAPEKERERKRAERAANSEAINARRRAARAADPEHRRGLDRAWREVNREKERERSRAYREANSEKEIERHRAWREAKKSATRSAGELHVGGEAAALDEQTD